MTDGNHCDDVNPMSSDEEERQIDWFNGNVEPILTVIGREIRGRSVEVRGKAVCFPLVSAIRHPEGWADGRPGRPELGNC